LNFNAKIRGGNLGVKSSNIFFGILNYKGMDQRKVLIGIFKL
jgi:hypothetical protein